MVGESNVPHAAVHAASIRVPEFMETAAAGWFAILEAQLDINRITVNSTKFNYVLSNLPPDMVVRLPPPLITGRDYDSLKEAVIALHEKTKPEIFAKLISASASRMTGRPSCYLQELQSLATKAGVGEELVRHQFIQGLPAQIAPAVAAQKELSLQQLGTLADELMPLASHTANAVQQDTNRGRSEYQRNNYSRQSDSDLPYGLRPFKKDQRPKVCRWHLYYGPSSKSCKPWCTFPDKSNCRVRARSPSPASTRSPSLATQEN